MSILNGNISGKVMKKEDQNIGNVMHPLSVINEPSVAVACLDDIVICGGEKISLYRVMGDGSNQFISSVDICGKARQMITKDGFLYVTARENGVYICDLTKPETPKIIYNLDTIELATGISVADNILAVTNRHMGCELFDISKPEAPVRVGHFMCGEAQSVCLYDKYAVIGDWMNKRARIFEISDLNNIKELSQMYVDGFADGVCTFEKEGRLYCAVGCGHHSARLKNRIKYAKYTYVTVEMINDGYGGGHGVEFYDITNPEMPEWVSTIKTPPFFGGPDTWLVFTDGEQIVYTDSMNGVFVISVDDVYNPEIVNSYKLPPLEQQRPLPPSIQIQTDAITFATFVNGYLCTASEVNGVHILKTDKPLRKLKDQNVEIKNMGNKSTGQMHSFVQYGDKVYCACGNEGIEVLNLSGELICKKATNGICRDIIIYNDMLVSAESDSGIAVYDIDENLAEKDRIEVNSAVRQIVKTSKGIAVASELSDILFYEEKKGEFAFLAKKRIPGILYHRHLAEIENKVVANPLSVGPVILDEESQKIIFSKQFCPFSDGACGYGDKLISIYQGKCFVSDYPYDEHKEIKIEGAKFDGQPFIVDGKLVLLNRYNGGVEIIDIEKSALLKQVNVGSYPEFCGVINNEFYVACGADGMIKV